MIHSLRFIGRPGRDERRDKRAAGAGKRRALRLRACDGHRSESDDHGEADEGEPSFHKRFLLNPGICGGHGPEPAQREQGRGLTPCYIEVTE